MQHTISSLIQTLMRQSTSWKITLLADWKPLMGSISDHARVEKIVDSTVFIGVYDSSWMHELYMLSPTLIAKINTHLQHPYVTDLRFKMSTKYTQKAAYKKKYLPFKLQEITLNSREKSALKKITDPELSSSLEKFLARCRST